MKIAFFDAKGYDKPGFDKYSENAGIKIKYFETKLNEDTVNLAHGFDAVCVFVNDTVNARVIDRLAEMNVKAIALRCAGFNNVDMRHAFGKIHVLRVPAYSPYAVAEHAMALLLTSIRRIHKAYIRSRDFNFSLSGLTGFDLHGKTMGVVGTGRIGRVFIDICRGFGMRVIAYDKYPAQDASIRYVTPEELFAESDVISLHCPLTDETHHMVNAETIKLMKPTATIINTSRGGLINTYDLIQGLKEKRVGAACLDVYEEEGDFFYEDFSGHIVRDDKLVHLIAMPNVLVTSHQAFLTEEALSNIAETTIDNLLRFFRGEPNPATEVRYEEVAHI